MDALAGDPLAHLCLTNNVYAEIIKHLLSFDRPILATGGGGYNVDNTVRAWALAWNIFADGQWYESLRDEAAAVSEPQREAVIPAIEATIKAIKANVFPFHGL